MLLLVCFNFLFRAKIDTSPTTGQKTLKHFGLIFPQAGIGSKAEDSRLPPRQRNLPTQENGPKLSSSIQPGTSPLPPERLEVAVEGPLRAHGRRRERYRGGHFLGRGRSQPATCLHNPSLDVSLCCVCVCVRGIPNTQKSKPTGCCCCCCCC